MKNNKFKIGDHVEVVNYGSLIWQNKNIKQPSLSFPVYSETEDLIWYDMQPNLIGKTGVIVKINSMGDYAVDGIKEKYAWYSDNQLELINA